MKEVLYKTDSLYLTLGRFVNSSLEELLFAFSSTQILIKPINKGTRHCRLVWPDIQCVNGVCKEGKSTKECQKGLHGSLVTHRLDVIRGPHIHVIMVWMNFLVEVHSVLLIVVFDIWVSVLWRHVVFWGLDTKLGFGIWKILRNPVFR